MDSFTTSTLKEWGFSAKTIEIFEDEDINKAALLNLTETMITDLFPKIGQRSIFSKNLENLKKQKMSWYVVQFSESNEFTVIPTNWIIENNSDSLYCHWPPYKVTRDHLKIGEDPGPSWNTLRVKIVGVNKIYDNFSKAWCRKVQEQYSLTDDTDGGNIKKSYKRPLTSSDDYTDSNFKIMPQAQAIQAVNIPSTTEQVNISSDTSSSFQDSNSEISTKEMHFNDIKPNLTNPQNNVLEEPKYFCHASNEDDSSICINAYHRTSSNIEGKLNNILEEQIGIKLLLNRVLSILENNDQIQPSIIPDDIFLSKFPINDPETFILIENCILNEFGFKSKLEFYIKSVGGGSFKTHVRRAMKRLFTDEYALKCTWTGRGKHVVTKIGNSILIMTVKKSIQEIYKDYVNINDSEFHKVVSLWLSQANNRISYKNHNNNSI